MGLIGPSGTIKAITRQLENIKNRTKLSDRALDVIKQANSNEKQSLESDALYDLVYILKESEDNPDLVMSLRSIEKFCTYRNVWIIGYKP